MHHDLYYYYYAMLDAPPPVRIILDTAVLHLAKCFQNNPVSAVNNNNHYTLIHYPIPHILIGPRRNKSQESVYWGYTYPVPNSNSQQTLFILLRTLIHSNLHLKGLRAMMCHCIIIIVFFPGPWSTKHLTKLSTINLSSQYRVHMWTCI